MKTYKNRSLDLLAGLLLTLIFNFQAGAWGSTGHRAIAEIAYHQLDKSTKKKIRAILGDDYLPLYATYADDIRSEKNDPLGKVPHYVNMPFGVTYEKSEKSERGDLVSVLNDMVKTLKDPNAKTEEKAVALKFIIHLVGDAHQPMHVGLAEDLGGNRVAVTWFKKETNLHAVWDEDLIGQSKLSYTELARFAGEPGKEEIQKLNAANLVDWINETQGYTKMIYENLGDKNYGYDYYYRFSPVMFHQVRNAGYRLGNFLNQLMKDI